MEMALVVVWQTVLMFLFMAIGYALFKTKKITAEGSKVIANILVYAILPAVIIKSFCKEPTVENMQNLGLSALFGLIAMIVCIVVSRVIFPKAPLDEFACAFSNVGFFGIPLIQSTPLGDSGVFFIAMIVAFVNIGQWTYGVMRITDKPFKEVFSPKKLLLSPFILATLVGIVFFFTGIGVKLTQIEITKKLVFGLIDGLSVANTPLAMLVIGCYLAQTDFKSLFTTKSVYKVCLVRLVIIPIVLFGVFSIFAFNYYPIIMAIYIAGICPVGSNVAVYAQLHGKDYSYAVKTVTLSTVLSIVSMPLFIMLANLIWL
ncbi:MAG: permease [Clostridiales bacterium]|nr:permease [Clostridiales bacterium]